MVLGAYIIPLAWREGVFSPREWVSKQPDD